MLGAESTWAILTFLEALLFAAMIVLCIHDLCLLVLLSER